MSIREAILTGAISVTTTSREEEYGPPMENLSACATLWEAYLTSKYPATFTITAEDVAWLNVLQKMARTFSPTSKEDTYVDAAAYAAIAGECNQLTKAEADLFEHRGFDMTPSVDPSIKMHTDLLDDIPF